VALTACGGVQEEPSPEPRTGDLGLTYAMPEADGEAVPYRVYVPSAWKPEQRRPLVMVLHGFSGDANSPFEDANGLLQELAEKHGFIVASPNGYNGMADYGANLPLPSEVSRGDTRLKLEPSEESALAQADVLHVQQRVAVNYNVDADRIYLMGNSMGMTGVLHLAATRPERWCAISASGGPPWPDYPAERLAPISAALLVHGARDDIARPSDTEALTERLKAAGVNARMQLIPEGTHGDAWVRYLPETFEFFAQHECRAR
jgi:poly(3-hydroxybutyrate) depolymerase